MSIESKPQNVEVTTTPAGTELAAPLGSRLFGPLEEAERLMERLMPNNWMRSMHWNWPLWGALEENWNESRVPSLEILDRDQDMLMRVEMPGVERKDVSVSLTDHTLCIEGQVTHTERVSRGESYRSEIRHGNFVRKLSIPDIVDPGKITASLKDGILEVVLPKLESLQRRAIPVK